MQVTPPCVPKRGPGAPGARPLPVNKGSVAHPRTVRAAVPRVPTVLTLDPLPSLRGAWACDPPGGR